MLSNENEIMYLLSYFLLELLASEHEEMEKGFVCRGESRNNN